MTLEAHSITLRLGEADEDLWEVLNGLSHDQQGILIKAALKHYLRDHPERLCDETALPEFKFEQKHRFENVPETNLDVGPELSNPESSHLKRDDEATLESLIETSLDNVRFSSEWTLDSLFISKIANTAAKEEKDLKNSCKDPLVTRLSDPLRHLFEVIGEEEDEEVIRFLSASEKPSSPIQMEEDSRKDNYPLEIEPKKSLGHAVTSPIRKSQVEAQLETHQEANLRRSSGLSFILQQVIGEEEDEEVLEFFEHSRNRESHTFT